MAKNTLAHALERMGAEVLAEMNSTELQGWLESEWGVRAALRTIRQHRARVLREANVESRLHTGVGAVDYIRPEDDDRATEIMRLSDMLANVGSQEWMALGLARLRQVASWLQQTAPAEPTP